MKIQYLHWTKSPGIGGKILTPSDFVVKEIINKKFMRKFARRHGGIKEQSRYFLYLLRKENITTSNALEIVADYFKINKRDIGYAGLKDKFAITEQYITMDKDVGDVIIGNLSLKKIKSTDNMIAVGELEGNEFVITLHDTKSKDLTILKEIKSKQVPNYFGLQRFGANTNNHIIGRHLIKRNFGNAVKLINKNSEKKISDLRTAGKERLKFYIHAYQSWIFNEALNILQKKRQNIEKLKIIGCDTKLGNSYADKVISTIINKEGVKPKDFSIVDLGISCRGSLRRTFISVPDIVYDLEEDRATLRFTLPSGSYATVIINEIRK